MKRIGLLAVLGLIVAMTFRGVSALAAGADPEAELKKAIKDRNIATTRTLAEQMSSANNEKAFQGMINILKGLQMEDMEYYWAILNAMANFTGSDVVGKMTDYIIKNKSTPLAKDILTVLKLNKCREILPLLEKVLQGGTDEMKIMAIEHMAELYYKETIKVLVDFIATLDDKKNSEWVRKVAEALASITGLERGSYVQSWTYWWNENKDKPEAEIIKPMKGSTSETGTAADHMGYVRNTSFNRLKQMPADKIIVVSALDSCLGPTHKDHNFDHIEEILTKFGIPHTVVTKKDFDIDSYKLTDKWFVGINCNMFKEHCTASTCFATKDKANWRLNVCGGPGPHNPSSNRFRDTTVLKVEEFVANGGFLFTEDAEIEELLERGFKGVIRHSEYLPEKVVKIFPAFGVSTHPYLKGVFDAVQKPVDVEEGAPPAVPGETLSRKIKSSAGKASWKIDNDSPDLIVVNPGAVTVLIVSPSLKGGTKETGGSPLAVTFGYSKEGNPMQVVSAAATGGSGYAGVPMALLKAGRVMHVMSHFGKQKSSDDEFPLQNLIVNFFVELNERKLGDARKK
ncbi:MAG: hypothetical protein V1701_06030 [Planctomycetota bacterium]